MGIRVSVCLAAYNGESYIVDQVISILSQLGSNDELLIADDCSVDNTVSLLEAVSDERVVIMKNKINLGYIKNFESLLGKSKGEYVFLSDQDDLWVPGRVNKMIAASNRTGKSVVVGRYCVLGSISENKENICSLNETSSNQRFSGLSAFFLGIGPSNFGSCMMLKRASLRYIYPFILNKVSHDHHIAILSNLKKDVCYLNEVVTYRRVHGSNLTNAERSWGAKILTRARWFSVLLICICRS